MTRAMLLTLGILISSSALAQDPAPAPFDPVSLTGSWSVTGRSTGGIACNDGASKVLAYQWILRVQPEGETTVTAQGETAYPKMTGQLVGKHLEVSGKNTEGNSLAHFAVDITGDTFSGTRTWISTSLNHCTWNVEGRRL